MRVLVLGAGGQVGSDLVPALAREDAECWMADRLAPEDTAAWPSLRRAFRGDADWRRRWRTIDASSADALRGLLEDIRPSVVYHLVAILSARGEQDPEACWRVNMTSLRIVLDTLAGWEKDPAPKVIWPSSIAAFGPLPDHPEGFPAGPLPNEFPLQPQTMYGVTKVAGELLGAWYAHHRALDFRSVRYPGLLNTAPPGGGSSDYANMMYFAAARGDASVDIFVRPDTRIPFMYMPDAVRALTELAAAPRNKLSRTTYNIAAISPSAEEIAESLKRIVPGFQVHYKPDHRQAYVDSWPDAIDDTPARRDWGWTHHFDLDRMSRDLIAALRSG